MRTPVDVITGRIVDYDERSGELTIKARYPDWWLAVKREYRQCRIQLIDGRPLSTKQRNVCYKLMREIAESTGHGVDRVKEEMKAKFIAEEMFDGLDDDFSLSDAPMSVICAFQRFIVRFMLDYDIPACFPLLQYVDDVPDYLYSCLARKKCCICGQHSDLHHVDRVGMGRNRNEIIHEGMEALPLCRQHHNEVHSLGERRFFERYHLDGGVILDKTLCDIYKLHKMEEEEHAEPSDFDGTVDT